MFLVAAAPPPGSEQYDLLMPFSDEIKGLTNPTTGMGCCGVSVDCRAVEARMGAMGYDAFLSSRVFDGAPDKWVRVPESVILRRPNDIGVPVACWSATRDTDAGFYCFLPQDGI